MKLNPTKLIWRGAGWIWADLEPGVSLHIWHPDFPGVRRYRSIHSHYAYAFHSDILIGRMFSPVFKAVHDEEKGDFNLFYRTFKGRANYVKYAPPGRVRMEHQYDIDVPAGESYAFGGPGLMHELLPVDELLVTYYTENILKPGVREVFALPVGMDPEVRIQSDAAGPGQEQMNEIV
jgi:hypothetical protein